MRVSVVMAGRNSNPALLKEAINSVLNQTFKDFEFIIVDDGSDKPLESIVHSVSSDQRISVYRIESSGLGAALNYGIKHSSGDLIARIDDDDISLPTRFEKQVAFMDCHPEVNCLGTQLYYKYGNNIYPHSLFPLNHSDILKQISNLHFVMGHTVLMYRRKSFDQIGGYRISGGGQDLDLFLQLGTIGELANLNEYLGCYTLSPIGLSVVNPKKAQAYLFALESALKYDGYNLYFNDIRASINYLKVGGEKPLFQILGRFKRRILIFATKYLGRNIDKLLRQNKQ